MEHCYCLNYIFPMLLLLRVLILNFLGHAILRAETGGGGTNILLPPTVTQLSGIGVRGLIPFSTLLRGVRYTLLSDTCTWFFFQIMSIPTGPSVAIIGGGVSGLVSAIRLNQLGLSKVTVFDTGKNLQFSVTNRHIIRLFPKVKLISRSVSEAKI